MSTDKSELLAVIRRAKSSHIRWRAFAQGLVAGVPVKEENLPINHTDCRFGQWYFGLGVEVLGKLQIFRDLQGPHEMLHSLYAQIHNMVGRKKLAKAADKLEHLYAISRTLLEQLELLENEVEAAS